MKEGTSQPQQSLYSSIVQKSSEVHLLTNSPYSDSADTLDPYDTTYGTPSFCDSTLGFVYTSGDNDIHLPAQQCTASSSRKQVCAVKAAANQ